jgi:hypothetical protein
MSNNNFRQIRPNAIYVAKGGDNKSVFILEIEGNVSATSRTTNTLVSYFNSSELLNKEIEGGGTITVPSNSTRIYINTGATSVFNPSSASWVLANIGGYGASDTPASTPGTFKDSAGIENGWQCRVVQNNDGTLRNDFLPRLNTLDINLNPYAHIIIGSGHYVGGIVINTSSSTSKDIIFDGNAKWTFTGDTTIQNGDVGTGIRVNRFRTHYLYIDAAGFNINISGSTTGAVALQNYTGCVFENFGGFNKSGSNVTTNSFGACVFINNTSINPSIGVVLNLFLSGCVIINTNFINFTNISSLLNSYVDENSTLTMASYFSSPTTRFLNCNFRGKIIIGANQYEAKRDKSGVLIPERVGNGILDLASIDANVYNRGVYSQNAQYLNIDNGDYWSVEPTSPMVTNNNLFRENIANCNVVTSELKANDNSIFITPTLSDIDLVGDNLEYVGAGTNGNISSSVIDLGSTKILGEIRHIWI